MRWRFGVFPSETYTVPLGRFGAGGTGWRAFLIALALAIAIVLSAFLVLERWSHDRRVRRIPVRIHVNGIRGKSTVTRILAGMLRDADYVTVAKATGTATMAIDGAGDDHVLRRRGAASILEQIGVIRRWTNRKTDAVVIECMALKPHYQQVSERRIIRSTIGVITNVREDHQDVMGETLPEIAASLAQSCPYNGVLITAEGDPELQAVLRNVASSRGSTFIVADPEEVTDDELGRFEYIAFKDNVAIGLEVAKLLGIDRERAMAGMVAAAPDPGVLRVRELEVAGKRLTWANLFAVNDRESMIVGLDRLAAFRTGDTTMVGILNNRADRERRALQFADIAARDLDFDRLVTFGAYEGAVTGRLLRNGFDGGRIVNLGDDRKPSIGTILQECVADMPTSHVLLVGFVNIHTAQAEALMEYLERAAPAAATAPAAESGAGAAEERVRAVGRMRPQRRHRAVAQLRTRRPRLAGRFRSQRWALRAGHARPLRDAQPGTRMRPQRRPQAQTRVLPALAPGRMRPQHAAVALERELEMAA